MDKLRRYLNPVKSSKIPSPQQKYPKSFDSFDKTVLVMVHSWFLLAVFFVTNWATFSTKWNFVEGWKVRNWKEIQGRIVGGMNAAEHEHPSLVLIRFNGTFKCGGTIISDEYILTAAHCMLNGTTSDYTVVAGKHSVRKYDYMEVEYRVTKRIQHERYEKDAYVGHDIGLLKVYPPIHFTRKIQKVDLPPKGFVATGTGLTVGWGVQKHGSRKAAEVLQTVSLPVINDTFCQKLYSQHKLMPSQLCTLEDGKDACQGDSAGPLYQEVNGRQIQIGVTSWGEDCAFPGQPGVWAEVSYYIDWINSHIIEKDY